jgi:hypothetical protein
MRFCNLNTLLSNFRQGIVFHSTVVLKLVLDVYIATSTSTFQITVPLSAYSPYYKETLASETIPPSNGLRLATCSENGRFSENASGGYFVPNFSFVAGFRILSLHRVYCECLLVCR